MDLFKLMISVKCENKFSTFVVTLSLQANKVMTQYGNVWK